MGTKKYKIGHLMGTIFAEYPSLLYKGSKEAVLKAGHTFVRIGDQVAMQREIIDYDEILFSFWLAERIKLDAYVVSPGSIFQLFKDISKSSVDTLVKILPPDRTIIMDSDFPGYRSVAKDNAPGMRECMHHLIHEMGYKHIAFIGGQKGSHSSMEREAIYWEELRNAGLPTDESYFRSATYWGQCEDVVDDLLDAHPDIDAIACAVDRIAYSCYNSITARGLTVGKDIAVTGFDDLPDSSIVNPPLTSIKCNAYDIGRIAALEAIRLCQGLEQEQFTLKSKLVVRASSDPSKSSEIRSSFNKLLHTKPIPWNDVVKEFVRLSWRKDFGDEYESYKEGITNIFIHFDSAYKHYLETGDTSVPPFKEAQLMDFLQNTKMQNDFSLAGLQNAFYDFYKAVSENLSEKAQLYFSEQFSLLNMLISRIFYEDLKTIDSTHSSEEILSLKIMDDAFIFSNNRQEAVRHTLKHIQDLGFNFALLYNIADPLLVDDNPAFSDATLFLQGVLHNGEITTYEPEAHNVSYEDILNNPFADDFDRTEELSVCALVSNKIATGYIVLDNQLDPFRQNAITQMLSYSSRHIYMIEKEIDMIRILNENNLNLSKESTLDPMTGLYNRRGFIKATDSAVKKLIGKQAAFFYMDLDGLKGINDALGHDRGDTAIKNTAEILKNSFRSTDILCRMGGDEFVAFVELANESDIEAISDRIEDNMNRFNSENTHDFFLSISIGYKIFTPTEENVKHLSTLLKEADKMLYDNKNSKKEHRRRNSDN